MGDAISILAPCAEWGFERGVKDPVERNLRFKETCGRVRSYVNELEPPVRQLAQTNEILDRPRSETSEFDRLIREVKAVLDDCSKGTRVKRFLRRSHYVAKLEKLEKSLKMACTVQTVRNARDGAEDRMLRGLTALKVIGAPCEAPKPPEFTVGLEPAMEDLKWKILEEKDCKVLVLTAPAGRGKTTLAKKLCHDGRIKGKFNTNIMFVTVSSTPDLTRIVGDLCSRNGFVMPQLQSYEDQIDKLREVLEEIGKRPLLLVLDDVWPGSELLIKKFTDLNIPEYKILVTSRSKFPGSGHSYELEELKDEDALALFRHHAISKHVNSDIPDEIIQKVVSQCMNLPLALELIGASLCGQVQEIWESKSENWSRSDSSVVGYEKKLINILRRSLELLPEKEKLKECFIDLCSLPKDQRIAATILIDVWTELHCLTEKDAAANLYHLCNRNLAHLVITRSDADEKDGDYSEHFLTPHDMLRELAIYESKEDSQTKRLIVNLRGNNLPDISKPLDARLVSITSDGSLPSEWCNIHLPETEVLILNFHAENYEIPEFVKSMAKLKLLILTNQSYFKAKLTNFELLDSLADLKTIRLEGIDVASLSETQIQLKNLHKLSLVMCKIGQAFSSVAVSELLKCLTELNIHYCNDLTTLPSGLTRLKKLRVTRCHKLSLLPQDIGEMENLEELKLRSCIDLEKLPESICELSKLSSLDISECFSVRDLPERIGNLGRLERLNIKGCSRLQCFPQSILELEESLKDVACDEDMKELLESHLSSRTKMKIRVPKEYINLNGL